MRRARARRPKTSARMLRGLTVRASGSSTLWSTPRRSARAARSKARRPRARQGCGALGSAQVETLARAGVGSLLIADRDFVEESNLQRQTMFTERDARERVPKAVAAARRVAEVNSDVECDSEVVDVNRSNVERLISDCDLVLDGTDNFS